MNARLFWFAPILVALAASSCGNSASGSGGGGGASASGQTTASSGSSGSASSGSGGATPSIPLCQAACTSAADCAVPNVPAYDASHYACDSSVCQYTGCKSDAECTMLLQKQAVCTTLGGATTAACIPGCSAPADCAIPNVPAYDASHYACTGGACQYTGCKSDAECTMVLQKQAVCTKLGGATTAACFPACSAPADCAVPNTPAYDASHYACSSGVCEYTGCKSAAECTMFLMKPAVCK